MTQTLSVSLELKSLEARQFEGHGSVFGNVDLGGDIVVRGAFRKTLAEHKRNGTMPQMFWMHDPSRVPGKWLEMSEDDAGLAVKGVLADTELGNEMRTLAKMKAVRGLSIGYVPTDVDYDRDGNRVIKSVDLWEVSLVSLAMNPLARVEATKARLSHLGEYVPDARELENILRKCGMSQLTAKRVISAIRELPNLDDTGIRDVDRTRDVDVESLEAAAIEAQQALDKFLSGCIRKW